MSDFSGTSSPGLSWIKGCKMVVVWYTDKSLVVAATSDASIDLSDIAIDDDHSQLDEFLASSTQLSGKYNQHVFILILQVIFLVSDVTGTCDPPSTDCSTCPLQHLRLPFLRFCWSYSLEFTA